VSVALDPVKTAYTPGRFRVMAPAEVLNHPVATRMLTRFVDDVSPFVVEMTNNVGAQGRVQVIDLTSLHWQRRRVGTIVADLTLWLDAWADRALVGGRMALRSLLADDETIHANEELPL
jgi:hypothetical protein